MKLQIKEELRLIAYPETTSVNAPARNVILRVQKREEGQL